MTPTNNQIYMAAVTILDNSALTYPVSYPGFNFTPPSSGVWLEVEFFPNTGLDNGLRYADTVIPQGIYQVACVSRPGAGLDAIHAAADEIRSLYDKGKVLIYYRDLIEYSLYLDFEEQEYRLENFASENGVRVIREPYDMELETMDDRLMVVVTVEYSG